MARIYKTDGTSQDYPPPANGTSYTLQELRQAIGGGYIEIVQTTDGRLMVINEEGKLKGLPLNSAASDQYPYGGMDPIVGDALVCEAGEID